MNICIRIPPTHLSHHIYVYVRISYEMHTCKSFCGFQSLSKRMTVSADCRFKPRPPAFVDNMKMKYSLPSALNACIGRCYMCR